MAKRAVDIDLLEPRRFKLAVELLTQSEDLADVNKYLGLGYLLHLFQQNLDSARNLEVRMLKKAEDFRATLLRTIPNPIHEACTRNESLTLNTQRCILQLKEDEPREILIELIAGAYESHGVMRHQERHSCPKNAKLLRDVLEEILCAC